MNHRVTSLTSLIFIALFAGAITGILIQNFMTAESLQYFRNTVLVDGVFYVVGTGFIRLMQMLNACCSLSILFYSLWSYVYWRHKNTWHNWIKNTVFLLVHYSYGNNYCINSR